MLVEITVPQMLARHTGECQVRSVERAQAQVIEFIGIVAGKPLGAIFIGPDPFAESVLQLLLLLAGDDGLLLVDDARTVFELVVRGGDAAI